jgi:hypothetical protein
MASPLLLLTAVLVTAAAVLGTTFASLPVGCASHGWLSGTVVHNVSVPLLDGDVLTLSPAPLPLVVMVLDPSDPFTSHMTSNAASLAAFSEAGVSDSPNTNFLFVGATAPTLQQALSAAPFQQRLHYAQVSVHMQRLLLLLRLLRFVLLLCWWSWCMTTQTRGFCRRPCRFN